MERFLEANFIPEWLFITSLYMKVTFKTPTVISQTLLTLSPALLSCRWSQILVATLMSPARRETWKIGAESDHGLSQLQQIYPTKFLSPNNRTTQEGPVNT